MADPKDLSVARFGAFAEGYVTSKAHAQGKELERLVEIARPKEDWLVLDVAIGGGQTAVSFAPTVSQVIATDIAPEMLREAEAHLQDKGMENVSFEIAEAEDLPFDDERFDMVTCRIAPHHFPDCGRFAGEAGRVLKPGGLLLVKDLALPEDKAAVRYVDTFEKVRDPSHHCSYSASGWEAMFKETGLTV
jgi:ubiquinone/menaquinone biosynthesis C-methylase UbiE